MKKLFILMFLVSVFLTAFCYTESKYSYTQANEIKLEGIGDKTVSNVIEGKLENISDKKIGIIKEHFKEGENMLRGDLYTVAIIIMILTNVIGLLGIGYINSKSLVKKNVVILTDLLKFLKK